VRGFLFVLYGLICYAIFFATFLYAIAFVENLPVPKTIDRGGEGGGLAMSLAVNVLLLGVFAIQHSVMARPAFKRVWTRLVPPPIERSTYVLFASLALAALIWFWRPMTQPVWTLAPGVGATAVTAVSWLGWGMVLLSTFLISHFELFGLTQVWGRLRNRAPSAPEFRTPMLYGLVRHPLYVGFILAFWATPAMTLGHLVFAVATLGYILVAIQFEERDLIDVFGERYRAYRRQVGMLVPRLAGGSKRIERQV
jgi:protein-S-isoprenylcysteine O-methyltransferase Ste14